MRRFLVAIATVITSLTITGSLGAQALTKADTTEIRKHAAPRAIDTTKATIRVRRDTAWIEWRKDPSYLVGMKLRRQNGRWVPESTYDETNAAVSPPPGSKADSATMVTIIRGPDTASVRWMRDTVRADLIGRWPDIVVWEPVVRQADTAYVKATHTEVTGNRLYELTMEYQFVRRGPTWELTPQRTFIHAHGVRVDSTPRRRP
jgi:hypothetical protein